MHLFHEAQTTFSPRLSEVATHHTHGIHDDAIFIIRKACLTQQGMITLAKSQDVDIQLTHLMDLMDQFCLVPAFGTQGSWSWLTPSPLALIYLIFTSFKKKLEAGIRAIEMPKIKLLRFQVRDLATTTHNR